MKKFFLLLMLILLSFLYGCGKKDINEFATATGVGIDKTEDGFKLTVQIQNPYAFGSDAKDMAPVTIFTEEGKTVSEALAKLSNVLPFKLYLFHIQLLLFGEDVAKEGIEKYINYFSLNSFTQHNYNIAVVEGDTAENVLRIQTMLNITPSGAINNQFEVANNNYGISKITYMNEVLNDLRTKGIGLVLSSVKIEGDPEKGGSNDNTRDTVPDAKVLVSNLSVFKEDKMVGMLSESESLGYTYIMNKIKKSEVSIILDDGSVVSVYIQKSTSKITFELINNQPTIKVKVGLIGYVQEDMSGMTKFTQKYMDEVQTKTTYEVQKKMSECVEKAQKEYNSDIFRFVEVIHRKNPKYWAKIIEDYDTFFENLEIEFNTKTSLSRVS